MPTRIFDNSNPDSQVEIVDGATTWAPNVSTWLKKIVNDVFGTAAIKDIGSGNDQIPLNSNLSAGAYRNVSGTGNVVAQSVIDDLDNTDQLPVVAFNGSATFTSQSANSRFIDVDLSFLPGKGFSDYNLMTIIATVDLDTIYDSGNMFSYGDFTFTIHIEPSFIGVIGFGRVGFGFLLSIPTTTSLRLTHASQFPVTIHQVLFQRWLTT